MAGNHLGLVQRIEQMGKPMVHPWRGAERDTVLNIDLPKIREKLQRVAAALPPLRSEADGAGAREIVVAVSRLFGFQATSGTLREAINGQVEVLLTGGRLAEQDGLLRLVKSN